MWRAVQRKQPEDAFAFGAEGLTACCEDLKFGQFSNEAFGQRRQRIQQMFAAVENQEQAPAAQGGQQTGQGILRTDRQSERRCNGARCKLGIPECAEIDKENLPGQSIKLPVAHGDGDRRLADATRADNGYETMQRKFGCNLFDRFDPSDHFGGRSRQRPNRRHAAARWCRRSFGTGEGRGKTITAPRDVHDISRAGGTTAKDLAQGGDVEAEAPFIDIHVGPDLFDQVPFVHDLAGMLGKEDQYVECTPTDMKRSSIFLQQPGLWRQPEWTKRDWRVLFVIVVGHAVALVGKEFRNGIPSNLAENENLSLGTRHPKPAHRDKL